VVMFVALGICPVAASRSSRAVGGDPVVAAGVSAICVGCAYRNRGWLITWRVYQPVLLVAVAVLAVVAGSSHANDPRAYQTSHGETQWIVDVRVNCEAAEAHVDNANVVGRAISHNPVKRAQHITGSA